MSDERAVEATQLSQPPQTAAPQVAITYYEPHQLAELAHQGRLYVLADGGSGPAAGYTASQYAARKVLHAYYTGQASDPKTRLLNAIQQANADLVERNTQHPERRNMATTLTAALIHNEKLIVANVGDSRVYVAWDQDIEQLHQETAKPNAESPAAPLTGAGAITQPLAPIKPETPKSLPRLLGLEKGVNINAFSRRLFPGDVVILCSGGLTGYVADKEIAKAIARHPLDQAARRLFALAGERGNQDHIAISITRILSSPVAARPPAPIPLPSAPYWSEWEAVPKPPSKTATQPTAKPAPAKVIPTPQAKFPSRESLYQPLAPESSLPWKGSILIAAALVLLCVMLFGVGAYFVPFDTPASAPYLGAWLADSTETVEINLPATPESEQAAVSQVTTDEPAIEPAAPPTAPQATLVAENNSPVATPESAFVSPVGAPTHAPPNTSDVLPTSTPSPTLLPTIRVPAGCVSKGRFKQDVTVPDGEQFAPAEPFDKVWLVQNAGDCPWGPGYTVRPIGGDTLGAGSQIPLLEIVPPDTNGEIRLAMIAPAAPGQYHGAWQLFDLNGEPFGPELYVEIEVTASAAAAVDPANANDLYDFIASAATAGWSAGGATHTPLETEINEALPTAPGLVAIGPALLRGNTQSAGNVLLTYPDRATGFIEGVYTVDTPLQPTDALVVTLGFIKLPILPDDGVTFEVIYASAGGSEQVILSQVVQYQDSPISVAQPLTGVEPGQGGVFTLRVQGGNSLNQDWAVWIDARLIRP
jgi:protein phosphatase